MKIEIKPTLKLKACVKENIERLSFGNESLKDTLKASVDVPPLSWYGRCVMAINSANSLIATVIKIAVLAFLAYSVFGLMLLILHSIETFRQNTIMRQIHDVESKLNKQVTLINKRAHIIQKLGLTEFEKIPVLDLQGRKGETDYIDFLKPKDLSSPIMKAFDGRPILACKVVHESKPSLPEVHAFFQRRVDQDTWVHGCYKDHFKFHQLIGATTLHREEAFTALRSLLAGEKVGGFLLAI